MKRTNEMKKRVKKITKRNIQAPRYCQHLESWVQFFIKQGSNYNSFLFLRQNSNSRFFNMSAIFP